MERVICIEGQRLSAGQREELLSSLHKKGIRKLAFSAFAYEKELWEPGFMDEYLAQVSALGMKFVSAHGIWFHNNDLNWPDPEGRHESVKTQIRYLERAAAAGCTTFILHPGAEFIRYSREELWENFRESIRKMLPAAQACGVTLAIENNAGKFLGANIAELAQFVSSFDSEYVGVGFDTGCANLTGDPAEEFEKVSGLAVTAALTDNDGISPRPLPPGKGSINWQTLMEKLERSPRLIHCITDW